MKTSGEKYIAEVVRVSESNRNRKFSESVPRMALPAAGVFSFFKNPLRDGVGEEEPRGMMEKAQAAVGVCLAVGDRLVGCDDRFYGG